KVLWVWQTPQPRARRRDARLDVQHRRRRTLHARTCVGDSRRTRRASVRRLSCPAQEPFPRSLDPALRLVPGLSPAAVVRPYKNALQRRAGARELYAQWTARLLARARPAISVGHPRNRNGQVETIFHFT